MFVVDSWGSCQLKSGIDPDFVACIELGSRAQWLKAHASATQGVFFVESDCLIGDGKTVALGHGLNQPYEDHAAVAQGRIQRDLFSSFARPIERSFFDKEVFSCVPSRYFYAVAIQFVYWKIHGLASAFIIAEVVPKFARWRTLTQRDLASDAAFGDCSQPMQFKTNVRL